VSASLGRVAAVGKADVLTRLRRPSIAFLLAAMALSATLMIPDPSSGHGLLNINDARALYTSTTLAFSTAALLPFFLGLFGFYMISHAIGRDRDSRTGLLLATTPIRDFEYLLGKLLGNTMVLASVTAAFMITSMAMQCVRGEGPLQPLVYVTHYLVMAGPCIVTISMMGLLFECVPSLAGRGGDILYFFVWCFAMPLSLQPWKGEPTGGFSVGSLFDWSGMAFLITQVKLTTGSTSFSIGWGNGNASLPPVHFPGFVFSLEMLAQRSASLAIPLVLFPLALLAFRRFDPSKERAQRSGTGRGPLAMLDALARPLTSRLLLLSSAGNGGDRAVTPRPSFGRSLVADVVLTFRLRPALVLLVVASGALALTLPPEQLMKIALPVIFAALAPALADIACREENAGITGLVFSAPGIEPHLALWKLASTSIVAFLITLPLAAKVATTHPAAAVSVSGGALLASAFALLLGLATGTPKTFVALYLGFWYVVLNDGGKAPTMDFAGWYGRATPAVQLGYLAATVAAVLTALAFRAAKKRLPA
jgi:hypothetical protein